MDKKIIDRNALIRSCIGCVHRYILEQNAEYTIVYCTLHNKEISQHGYNCVSCEYNPYYTNKNHIKENKPID